MTKKIRKAWEGRSQGFTLIEIVIAMLLLGIIGVAILSALSTASVILIIADERATAESLARSQMEFVKNQDNNEYVRAPNEGEVTYQKIAIDPIEFPGYRIWSINRNGEVVEDVIGIPWESDPGNNISKPAYSDEGIQKIALVITHTDRQNQDEVIYSFINDNPDWADGVKITLEGYKREPVT